MRHVCFIGFALAVAGASSGCVLADSANSYPYAGPIKVINTNDDGEDMGEPDTTPPPVDMKPPPAPLLIFTELLIDSSQQQTLLGEYGEYIEIKNVGEGPADPQRIVMLLSDPSADEGAPVQRIQVALPATRDERDVVAALEQIDPGEYFVFVRYESEVAPISELVEPGYFYDYGIYAGGPSMPHLVDRRLELTYADPRTPEPFDVVRWRGGSIVSPDGNEEGVTILEDRAIVLDEASEAPEANDDPKNWCYTADTIGTGTAFGSPGSSSDCP